MPKQKRMKYRLGLLIFISFLAMLIAFCSYMMSTTLEEVLYDERGVQVITHSDDSGD
ncbi:MAG: hypothetical protein IKR76_05700 [Ruminococcus sp.]|nr:hypothetical protein [Ruminococcus sp.]